MFRTTNDNGRVDAQQNREAITLAELKKQLGYSTTAATQASGFTEATIEAFLLRFLRAKRLSTSEAIAKLKRRRAFETTLPTITITPAVISVLRSGAFSLLGNDNKGRPILFLNLKDFSLPPMEVDEAQRILIVLLEFMQSKCMAAGSNGGGANAKAKGGAADTGSNSGLFQQQSFVLLVNEEAAPWSVHLPLLRKAGALYSIYAKYFPGLIDLILIAEAAFEVRQGIQAALAGSSSETSRTVMMVQRSDLLRYMSEDVLPACLGGKLQTNGNALNFAEAVLRHWYTVTSFIQLENNTPNANGGASRPLFVPTPLISSSVQFISLQKAASMVAAAVSTKAGAKQRPGENGDDPLTAEASGEHARRGSSSLFSLLTNTLFPQASAAAAQEVGNDLTSQTSNSHYLGRGAAEDGMCSELSADDVTLDETDGGSQRASRVQRADSTSVRGPLPGNIRPLDVEESAKVRENPTYAIETLERERAMRIEAEQKLKIAELGVSLDPRNLSTVEKRLAGIHAEVNVLVADIVIRARASREKGSEATVSQLLDLTLTALETATASAEEVPAMSMAVPQQREPESSSCCSVM